MTPLLIRLLRFGAITSAACTVGAGELAELQPNSRPLYELEVITAPPWPKTPQMITIDEHGRVVFTQAGELGAWVSDGELSQPLRGIGGNRLIPVAANGRGQIAGYARGSDNHVWHAVLWNGVEPQTLPAPAGGLGAIALAVNDLGTAVGLTASEDEAVRVVIWHDQEPSDLGHLSLGGKQTIPAAINNLGQFVGRALTAAGEQHAFLWDDGQLVDLGTLGGTASGAEDINDDGVIVGWSSDEVGGRFAVRWVNGNIESLGALGLSSEAHAINQRGDIVGRSPRPPRPRRGAFLWRDGVMHDLSDAIAGSDGSIDLIAAGDINSDGQIIGTAWIDGRVQGVLLTPVARPRTPAAGSSALSN